MNYYIQLFCPSDIWFQRTNSTPIDFNRMSQTRSTKQFTQKQIATEKQKVSTETRRCTFRQIKQHHEQNERNIKRNTVSIQRHFRCVSCLCSINQSNAQKTEITPIILTHSESEFEGTQTTHSLNITNSLKELPSSSHL